MILSRSLAALTLAAALALPSAGFAQEDATAFREASPSCEGNPALTWQGRISGQSDENPSGNMEPMSFVGCFATEAECNAWRERGSGLIDGNIVENICEQRQ